MSAVTSNQPGELSADVWRLWVTQWGASQAIGFAIRQGYTREQILAANRQWMDDALSTAQREGV